MTGEFINMKCASCGGKLDIYGDMESFACGYCGSEMVVERRGGTIALKAMRQALKQVQIGTDKTAAELAIVRLERELNELSWRLSMLPRPRSPLGLLIVRSLVFLGFLFGGMAITGAFSASLASSPFWTSIAAAIVVCALGCGAWVAFSKVHATTPQVRATRAAIDVRIATVQSEWALHRAIVSDGDSQVRRCGGCRTEIPPLAKHCSRCGVHLTSGS